MLRWFQCGVMLLLWLILNQVLHAKMVVVTSGIQLVVDVNNLDCPFIMLYTAFTDCAATKVVTASHSASQLV